ncbi:unnamed protein product [Rangifer tarandus platyrhynchus]|uniref:Uncharacterized protein n=2 Tax=Rangifer tarandus platyrhynchus TaxID=3082113 RepID=A0AC59YME2_RANTA
MAVDLELPARQAGATEAGHFSLSPHITGGGLLTGTGATWHLQPPHVQTRYRPEHSDLQRQLTARPEVPAPRRSPAWGRVEAGAHGGTWRPVSGRDPSPLSPHTPRPHYAPTARPSAADLYMELRLAARLASSTRARDLTPCGCRPPPGGGEVNGKMEMDVEGVSPRQEPIPRSQGAGGACQAPSQPPQPQPQPPPLPPQHPAPDEPPGESAGAEDSDDPEARPSGDKGESKLVRVGFIPERRQQDSPKKAIHPGTQPSETAGVCE